MRPSGTSQLTSTGSSPAATSLRPTSKRRSWSIPWEKCSTPCAGSVPARLAAYAGLAPVDWQSGRSSTTRRARGGNHRLKNAMFVAAFVATRHDPDAPRLLPSETSRRQTPQRRGYLRCPPPLLQHHPGHAQDPNPLPSPTTRQIPESAPRGLATRQGHPPVHQKNGLRWRRGVTCWRVGSCGGLPEERRHDQMVRPQEEHRGVVGFAVSLNPPIHVPKTNPDQGDLRDPPLTGSCSSSQDRTILTNSYRRRSGGISTISPCPLRPPHRWIQG